MTDHPGRPDLAGSPDLSGSPGLSGLSGQGDQRDRAGGADPPGRVRAVRGGTTVAAAVLLGAACLVWASIPALGTTPEGILLFLAIVCVAGGSLRLSLAAIPIPEDSYLMSTAMRSWLRFLAFIRVPAWEEGAAITIIWLEVLHRSRPWHTAVLGAALAAYLITVHLAESGSSPAALRPQAPVLAAGACLLALGAGAGMLPATSAGAGSALLRVVAAVAVIIAAGLVLPYVTTRSRG